MSPMIGELRHRVTLKTISGRNKYGEAAPQTLDTVWAKVVPQSGQERDTDEEESRELEIEVTIRHRDDVGSLDLVEWDGDDYDIEAPLDEGGLGRWLVLRAVRRS